MKSYPVPEGLHRDYDKTHYKDPLMNQSVFNIIMECQKVFFLNLVFERRSIGLHPLAMIFWGHIGVIASWANGA